VERDHHADAGAAGPAGDHARVRVVLPAAEAGRFAAAVPSARMAEIDANHYTITTHDDSIAAIGAFRGRS
jgi:hypothetical protein